MTTKAEHSARRRAFWQAHFEARERSGLSVSRYVQEQGLSAGTFYAARQRYSESRQHGNDYASPAAPAARFARVVTTASSAAGRIDCRVRLHNGVMFEFSCEHDSLATALQAAASLT